MYPASILSNVPQKQEGVQQPQVESRQEEKRIGSAPVSTPVSARLAAFRDEKSGPPSPTGERVCNIRGAITYLAQKQEEPRQDEKRLGSGSSLGLNSRISAFQRDEKSAPPSPTSDRVFCSIFDLVLK